MKKVQLFESFVSEGFEVHYSDGVRAAKKFKSEKDAMSFTKEKIASGKCKEIAIYKDGAGFHSTADTEAVVAWWGDGSYLDNVSKKDSKLAAKKINESLVVEGQFSWMTQDTDTQIGSERENTITVYMFSDKGERWEEKRYEGYGEFGGKDYYELLAQMNGVENADRQDGIDIAFGKTKTKGKTLFPALVEDPRYNWKRHDFTIQPDNDPNQSWYQEEEYDDDDDNYDDSNESKVTEAKAKGLDWVISELGDKPKCYDVADFVYTNYDKVTGLRKSMRNDEMDFPEEIMDVVDHYGLDIDEFTDCYGMAAESLKVTEGVVSIKGGRIIAHKVLNKLVDMGLIPVKKKSEELLETIAEVITNAKMESVEVNEGAISDIHIMAQEAKDFKSFVKEFTKTHHDLSKAGEPGQFEAWLKSIYDDAKESMDESVVTEGKHWHVLSGNTWYTGSDFSTNPADAMKYDDIMSATKVAKKVGGMVHVMTDEEMTKAIKKFGKNESVVSEAIKPAGLSKAETKKVAETYAKAISKHDNCKCTVNAKSLEEDSFDLDIDGEEYAGGSYYITLDGDVINAALPEKPVYGQIDSTVDQIIKNLKK
jgi:hypothetical protein